MCGGYDIIVTTIITIITFITTITHGSNTRVLAMQEDTRVHGATSSEVAAAVESCVLRAVLSLDAPKTIEERQRHRHHFEYSIRIKSFRG